MQTSDELILFTIGDPRIVSPGMSGYSVVEEAIREDRQLGFFKNLQSIMPYASAVATFYPPAAPFVAAAGAVAQHQAQKDAEKANKFTLPSFASQPFNPAQSAAPQGQGFQLPFQLPEEWQQAAGALLPLVSQYLPKNMQQAAGQFFPGMFPQGASSAPPMVPGQQQQPFQLPPPPGVQQAQPQYQGPTTNPTAIELWRQVTVWRRHVANKQAQLARQPLPFPKPAEGIPAAPGGLTAQALGMELAQLKQQHAALNSSNPGHAARASGGGGMLPLLALGAVGLMLVGGRR